MLLNVGGSGNRGLVANFQYMEDALNRVRDSHAEPDIVIVCEAKLQGHDGISERQDHEERMAEFEGRAPRRYAALHTPPAPLQTATTRRLFWRACTGGGGRGSDSPPRGRTTQLGRRPRQRPGA